MRYVTLPRVSFAALALVILIEPLPALAYIDAGTISYLTQMLVAGFAVATIGLRASWGRIKLFFSGLKKLPEVSEAEVVAGGSEK